MAQSFDEALDAEAVLWAVRGMDASRLGVSAEDVAQFLSKDTTLSTRYDCDDVGVVLDSLTADGMLTYEPTTGEWAAIDANGNVEGAADVEDTEIDLREPEAGAHHLDDAFTGAFAELRPPVGETKPPSSLGESVAFLRLRIDVLERERSEMTAERDEWRRRAEALEQDVAGARAVSDDLRARVRELEGLLDRERAAGYERSDNARRAAEAMARAQEELERLGPRPVEDETDGQRTRSRRTLRGNWLS